MPTVSRAGERRRGAVAARSALFLALFCALSTRVAADCVTGPYILTFDTQPTSSRPNVTLSTVVVKVADEEDIECSSIVDFTVEFRIFPTSGTYAPAASFVRNSSLIAAFANLTNVSLPQRTTSPLVIQASLFDASHQLVPDTSLNSSTFTITGPAVRANLTGVPASRRAGVAMEWVISYFDDVGQVVSDSGIVVNMSLTSSNGAQLGVSSTLSVVGTSGVITLAAVIDVVGTGYVLRFTSSSPLAVNISSDPFDVGPGPLAIVRMITQPSGLNASGFPNGGIVGVALFVPPEVELLDASGNRILTAGTCRVLSSPPVQPSGANAQWGPAGSFNAANGTCRVSNVVLTSSQAGDYSLTVQATMDGVSRANDSITIPMTTSGAPSSIVSSVTATTNVSAGAILPQFTLTVSGANDIISTGGLRVRIVLGSGVVRGNVTRPLTAQGTVVFDDIAIDTMGFMHLNATVIDPLDRIVYSQLIQDYLVTLGPATVFFTIQPANGIAGIALPRQPLVTLQDLGGNPNDPENEVFDPQVQLVLSLVRLAGDGPAAFVSPSQFSVNSSVALISGLFVSQPGTYRLRGTFQVAPDTLAVGESQPFNITPPVVAILRQPSSAEAGLNFSSQPAVQLQTVTGEALDPNGTLYSDFNITVSLNGTDPTATIPPQVSSVRLTNGSANFTGLQVDRAGNYTVRFSFNNTRGFVAVGLSDVITISKGPPQSLTLTSAPQSSTGGIPLPQPVEFTLRDRGGNNIDDPLYNGMLVRMTLIALANGTNATLSTPNATLVSGVALFSNVTIDRLGVYVLRVNATAPNNLTFTTTTNNFTISLGDPVLRVLRLPSDGFAGEVLPVQPQVIIEDAGQNPWDPQGTLTSRMLAALTDAIDGTSAQPALQSGGEAFFSGGIVTFANMSIRLPSLYVFQFTTSISGRFTGTLRVTSPPFRIEPSAPRTLELSWRLPDNPNVAAALATQPFLRQPSVIMRDKEGNVCNERYHSLICSAAVNFTNVTAPVFLNNSVIGIEPNTSTPGTFRYTTLSVSRVGLFSLIFTVPANATLGTPFMTVVSPLFSVRVGLLANIVWLVPVSETNFGGDPFLRQPVLRAEDAGGNVITTAGTLVRVEIGVDPSIGGATLQGVRDQTFIGGFANYTDLSINKAAEGYRLRAVSGSVSTLSPLFDVTGGAAQALRFDAQPSVVVAGDLWPVQPIVSLTDRGGNIATVDSSSNITLALVNSPGSLLGNTTVRVDRGVANFTGLATDLKGTNFRLLATTTAGPFNGESATFTVVPGPPFILIFRWQVATANFRAGLLLSPQPLVSLVDRGGNVLDINSTVTISLDRNPGDSTLSGSLTVPMVRGDAQFTNIILNRRGVNYTLNASTPVLGSEKYTSPRFNLDYGFPSQIVFVVVPDPVTIANVSFSPQPELNVRDVAQNLITTLSDGSVLLSILGSGGAAGNCSLRGNTVRPVINGTVVFQNVAPIGFCNGVRLIANLTLPNTPQFPTPRLFATSDQISSIVGPIASVVFTRLPPTNLTAGALWPRVQVALHDVGGNLVMENVTANLSLWLHEIDTSNVTGVAPLAPTLLAERESFSLGLMDFFNLSHPKMGSFVLVAEAPALGLRAESTPFPQAFDSSRPDTFQFRVQPVGGLAAQPLATQPVFGRYDQFGNPNISDSSTPVNITLVGSGDTLVGETNKVLERGVAAFSFRMHKVGTYRLRATYLVPMFVNRTVPANASGGRNATNTTMVNVTLLEPTPVILDSSSFSVLLGPPVWLFKEQEPVGNSINVPWLRMPNYTVRDAGGNIYTRPVSALCELTLLQPPPVPGQPLVFGVLQGPLVAPVVNGTVQFGNLSVDTAAENYTLRAQVVIDAPYPNSPFVVNNVSAPITILPPKQTRLIFHRHPSGGTAAQPWPQTMEVWLLDELGDVVLTESSRRIWVEIATDLTLRAGNTTVRANILGSNLVTLQNGKASFPTLALDRVGFYRLRALVIEEPRLQVISRTIRIALGPPVRLRFQQRPQKAPATVPFSPPPSVAIVDAGDNIITTDSRTRVAVQLYSVPNITDPEIDRRQRELGFRNYRNVTLLGQNVLTVSRGVATFNDLTISFDADGAHGGYRLLFRTLPDSEGPPSRLPPGVTTNALRREELQRRGGVGAAAEEEMALEQQRRPDDLSHHFGLQLAPRERGVEIPSTYVVTDSNYTFALMSLISDSFAMGPAPIPPIIFVPQELANATAGLVWLSNTVGPMVMIASTAMVAGKAAMPALFARPDASAQFGIGYHSLLSYVMYMQMFVIPLEHNPDLKDLLPMFEQQRRFQGNVQDENTSEFFAYANFLAGKVVTLLILVLLYALLKGVYVETCFSSFQITLTTFMPFFLVLFLPLAESVTISPGSDLYEAVCGVGGGLIFLLILLVLVWVRPTFNKNRNLYTFLMPAARSIDPLCYRPENEFEDLDVSDSDREDGDERRHGGGDASDAKSAAEGSAQPGAPLSTGGLGHEHHGKRGKRLTWWQATKEKVRRWKCQCRVHGPRSRLQRSIERVEEKQYRMAALNAEQRGKVRNPVFEEQRLAIKLWKKYEFRPFFEPAVYMAPDPTMEPTLLEAVRQALCHYGFFIKLAFLLAYVTAAVTLGGLLQLRVLMGILVAYFAVIVVLAPFRNPYMQKEIMFTTAIAVQLMIVHIILWDDSHVWGLLAVVLIQCLVVLVDLVLNILFKEKPIEMADEFIARRHLKLEKKETRTKEEEKEIEDEAEHFLRLARIYWQTGGQYRNDRRYAYMHFAQGARLLQSLNTLDPRAAEPIAHLGLLHHEEEPFCEKARRFWRAALKLDPTNEMAGRGLAGIYVQRNLFDRAGIVYQRALAAPAAAADPSLVQWAQDGLAKYQEQIEAAVAEPGSAAAAARAADDDAREETAESGAGTMNNLSTMLSVAAALPPPSASPTMEFDEKTPSDATRSNMNLLAASGAQSAVEPSQSSIAVGRGVELSAVRPSSSAMTFATAEGEGASSAAQPAGRSSPPRGDDSKKSKRRRARRKGGADDDASSIV